ncbi:hypothetical protein [Maricaulis sp.]|uniref:hypothetical protein n=1 Tax=Maricaulis sp. TaxID=1486257 RepID=UPI0025BA54D2|nr:hypothetical protein [Maricaulis sp.]
MPVTAILRALARSAIGLVLLFAGPAVHAQPVAATSEDFQARLDEYRDLFISIDLADMRAIGAQMDAALAASQSCQASDCPDFDCAAANMTFQQAGELYMRFGALETAIDHMHQLDVAHLTNLHREALQAEEEAAYEQEVLYWQSAVINVASAVIQLSLLSGDIDDFVRNANNMSALELASSLDEHIRDTEAALGDMTAFRRRASDRLQSGTATLEAELLSLGDLKSDLANIISELQASPPGSPPPLVGNALAIAGRSARAIGQAALEIRQAEADRLSREAHRERSEAEQFLRRVHARTLQRDYAAQLADRAMAVITGLGQCVRASCAFNPVVTADPPRILVRPDPADPVRRPRLDLEVLEHNTGELRRIGLRLSADWTRPQCEAPPDASGPDSGSASPPDLDAILAGVTPDPSCAGLVNVGICSLLTPDRREACQSLAQTPIMACSRMPVLGAQFATAPPGSAAFSEAMAATCRTTCTLQYGLDAYLDHQRRVALDQVTELDRTHFENGGELSDAAGVDTEARDMLDSLRDQLRAARNRAARDTRHIYYDPENDAYVERASGEADGGLIHITAYPGLASAAEAARLEALQVQITALESRLQAGASIARTRWGQDARGFWSSYGSHFLLMCGGEELDRRLNACLAQCGGGMGQYSTCIVPAPDQSLDLGPVLYPPGDPRRDEIPVFNAREAITAQH